MANNVKISVTDLIEKEGLENLTPEIPTDDRYIETWEINRPALQLTGWYYDFDEGRVQVLGNVESAYVKSLDSEKERAAYDEFTSHNLPCLIYANNNKPAIGMITACHRNQIPLLVSKKTTTSLTAELTRWLKVQLAERVTVHGVLVDVYGIGVLIMGDSGIGKSEAALELIKRGHRLVSDDVVEIRKVSEVTLIGTAPEITKHFIELRGIGIIDVKTLFGVSSVRESQSIDLEIHLEEWDKNREFDRLGMEDSYSEYLGTKVTCHRVPVRPGRNVAIICESAAANHRQKLMGYNAAHELYQRFQKNLMRKRADDEEEED